MEEITLKIESLASSGAGVGTVSVNGMNRAVFVPYTAPGDLVKARIVKQHKKYYEAELVEITEKSKHRIKPVCEHFGVCGACDWLHIDYKEQVKAKEQMLRHFFKRNNIELGDIGIIEAENKLNYRDKIRVAAAGNYGLYARKTDKVIPIKKCYVINEELNKIFSEKPTTRYEKSFAYDYKTKKIVSEGEKAYYYYDDIELAYFPEGFAQNNLAMNKYLIKCVVEEAEGKKVLELYAGNGNFTIPLSRNAGRITAIEGSDKGFELLKYNIGQNNASNIIPVHDDVKKFIRKKGQYDCIILDPPRTGAGEIINKIANKTNKIIYVSCDAQILAKEIKGILPEFEIKDIKLIDMFPQTPHFETVITVTRKHKAF